MTAEECLSMGERMATTMMGGGMMGGGMMGGEGWGSLIGYGLLLLAVVIIGVVLVFGVGRRPPGPAADDPREILRRRFARGDIDGDEFAARLKALG